MLIENKIYKKDVDSIIQSQNIDWKKLKDKTVLVTGATGLIGSLIVVTLLEANHRFSLNCYVVAAIRNKEKAYAMFGEDDHLLFYINDIREPIVYSKKHIDYLVHTASNTDSKSFITSPVETIETTLKGTVNVLEFARCQRIERVVYLSTMEVYGTPLTDERIDEHYGTNLYTGDVRSCYPISKRMSEQLFASYSSEYGIDGVVLRLTQTFGPGVAYNDGRVFADFARCVIEGHEIILHTEGTTKRMYLYTADAVSAILYVMLKAEEPDDCKDGRFDIYNVANESTYCSIREMANQFSEIGGNGTLVKIQIEDINKYGYAPTLHMNLDTRKLKETGWKPQYDFYEMIVNLIDYMKSIKD